MAEEGFKRIIRLAGEDLKGSQPVQMALTQIRGVGPSMAKAITRTAGLKGIEKIGSLGDEQIEKLDEVLNEPSKYDIPKWLFNRRKDIETGDDLHMVGGDIEVARRSDVKLERKIRSRRGIRHELGLPVRGQRTKSTGRRGMTVGVVRKKLMKKRK